MSNILIVVTFGCLLYTYFDAFGVQIYPMKL